MISSFSKILATTRTCAPVLATALGLCLAAALTSASAAGQAHFSTVSALPTHPPALQAPTGTPCGSITITESSTQTITSGNSVSCNAGGLHTDNSYFRAFDLASLGAPDGLDVCEVQVGVEQATGATGTQPITVNLYTSDPLFPGGYPGSLTQIGTADIDIPDAATGTVFPVPVTGSAPAGSELVVEIFTPDGQTAGNSFFIGSNADPETGPSYLLAAGCGITSPATTADIGFPNMHIVLNALGNAPVGSFTVGGSVSGLVGSGLVLQNNGGDDLAVAADGSFTFATPLPDTSTYDVTVATQPSNPAQVCSVTNGSGTIAGADVTDVEVTCGLDTIFQDGFELPPPPPASL